MREGFWSQVVGSARTLGSLERLPNELKSAAKRTAPLVTRVGAQHERIVVSKTQTAAPLADKIEGIDIPYPRPLTKAELAKHLQVCPRTVDYLMARRKIPFIKLGGRIVRFRLTDVERALQRYTVEEVSL